MPHILIVEDDASIRDLLVFTLEQHDFQCVTASSAEQAIGVMAQQAPQLILLDWMLPGASGIDLAKRLKKHPQYQSIPIVVLTARSAEDDKVAGLDVGADDYIVKPFSPRELVARLKAVLRRTQPGGMGSHVQVGKIRIDTDSHRVYVDEQPVAMGPTEYRMLLHLLRHPERVFNRTQLLDAVWGHQIVIEERTIDVHVGRLRKALEPFGAETMIETVRSAGYRLTTHGIA